MTTRRDAQSGIDLGGGNCPECGKVRYSSRKAAKRAASQITSQHRGQPGAKLRPYRCGRFWHLTSQGTARLTMYREQDRGAAA